MFSVKLVDKRNTVELMNMLGLKEGANKQARENGVRWYGYVLRQPGKDVLTKAMLHEVDGKRKIGLTKVEMERPTEGNMKRIGLRKEVAADWCKKNWEVVGCIRPPPFNGDI